MARKTVATKPAYAILIVQDRISDVNDGLARARAIADLLEDSDPDSPPDTVTVVRAAEAIRRELEAMHAILQENIGTLEEAKTQLRAATEPQLEVVHG